MDKFSKYAGIELTHFFANPLVILDGQDHDGHLLGSQFPSTLALDRRTILHEPNCVNDDEVEWTVTVQLATPATCPHSVHYRLKSTKSHMTLSTITDSHSQPVLTIVPDTPSPHIFPRLKFSKSYSIHTRTRTATSASSIPIGSTTANTIKVCESGMLSLQAKLACPTFSSQHIVVKFGIARSTLHIFVEQPAGNMLIARGWIKPGGEQAQVQVAAAVDVVGVMGLVAVVVRARRDAARFWRLEMGA
ncbi:hypothetical protein BCR44DRAFT_1425419 [Catenaria anguillulae PL171]|uniref:Uncharacterized protein n=1 Tax=Catenaria anguillulae PL171 TaxID=765915 RepID=A0A1Y2I153_9FUNG|nr:hypothetical protein BCR44DRAFT_1425419 [Catenaria anguillulae PL171]